MIVNIGYFALLAAMVLTLYAIIACLSGIHRNSHNQILSARYGLIVAFLLVVAAFFSLCYAMVTDDFSVQFVAHHSSTDLPTFYKFTAVWGGMQGSLLLWELILSFFTAVVVFRYRETNKEILPYTLIVLGLISLFLLFLLVGWSNPLVRQFPAPTEGRGLNPLLQNPGMVYHPPSLYLGYVAFSIPFAFALGSLLRGKLDNEWILTTRRWTLFAWFFLTLGIILGGQWAYIELGWGGYWAWDPVENASLMPWLTGTAFLHSVIVQEKRNALKIWNLLLIIATFTLTILGTFITRSGILSSVHSFAKSNIGPAFLLFIAVVLIFSLGLLLSRLSLLSSKPQTAGILCKENSFLLNNMVFLVMAFTVLYGTVFPLLAEALADKKLSIQAPFFNTILAPMAVLMLFLMGITHVLGWKKTSLDRLMVNSLLPSACAVVPMIVVNLAMDVSWHFTFLSGTTVFAGCFVVGELIRSYWFGRSAESSQGTGVFEKLKSMMRDRRRRGGLIIHLGIVVLAVGVCGAFFNQETSFTFSPGEEKNFGTYRLKFQEKKEFALRNSNNVGIKVEVFRNDRSIGHLLPVKAFYPTSPQPMTEVAIRRSIAEDLYISLSSLNEDGSATVNVYINPLVNFVWASMAFFLVGIVFCFSHKPIQLRHLAEKR
ncbi:MAG: heme lyase CcmF/NrfE family subunit [Proteobacteria bacterium]|nr:heme lyase CcmF/NrfE family subunit [Pseudomonadota bacterium]